MSTVYTMVGIPGSGKTTWAMNFLEENPNCVYISSDQIRKTMYGSEDVLGDARAVFGEADRQLREAISQGKNVVYDATNISKRARKEILQYNAKHIAICMDTPRDVCLKFNKLRHRKVPEEVIYSMDRHFVEPTESEGYSEIIHVAVKS